MNAQVHETVRWILPITLGLLCLELGCSTSPGSSGPTFGGAVGSGGVAGASSGGATSSGGMLSGGGAPGSGGASGGATSSGGAPTSGGAPGSGGATPTSGGSASGGTPSGGTSGGSVNTGGATAGATVGGTGGRASGGAAGGGGAPSKGGSGGATADVCPRLDPANTPKMLSLTGNLGVHDPALIAVDGTYYMFATGNGIDTKTSKDMQNWARGPAVFSSNPSWIAQSVPAATNLWAPDIAYFGGQYHLYYSASSFGSNRSCIGHATRASLSSGSWSDKGATICSNPGGGSKDNWNAIDPNIVLDEAGKPWMAFGSFWSGIKMIPLDDSGARVGTELLSLANRPQNGGSLEGPFIVRACGYYYLFVSWDHCCDSPWNYNMRVGRSTSLSGPYVDKAGTNMTQGGGTLLVEGNSSLQGPGHNAIIFTPNGAYNVYHALNPGTHAANLRIAQIAWDDQGWPVTTGP